MGSLLMLLQGNLAHQSYTCMGTGFESARLDQFAKFLGGQQTLSAGSFTISTVTVVVLLFYSSGEI